MPHVSLRLRAENTLRANTKTSLHRYLYNLYVGGFNMERPECDFTEHRVKLKMTNCTCCGTKIPQLHAHSKNFWDEHGERVVYFCSIDCQNTWYINQLNRKGMWCTLNGIPTTVVPGVTDLSPRTTQSLLTTNPSAESATARRNTMQRIILVLSTALWVQGVQANEPPPVPEGGLTVLLETPCEDAATKQKGTCYALQDKDGNIYVAFWQEGTLMFIRRPLGDSYEEVWVNDIFGTIWKPKRRLWPPLFYVKVINRYIFTYRKNVIG